MPALKPRGLLSAEAIARIRAKLNFLSLLSQQKMTVEIQSLGGDPESLALAGQIKTLFEGYGLEIKSGVQETVREKPLNGLVLESGQSPGRESAGRRHVSAFQGTGRAAGGFDQPETFRLATGHRSRLKPMNGVPVHSKPFAFTAQFL